jgi:DNA-binding PadR family transcriptional regulator
MLALRIAECRFFGTHNMDGASQNHYETIKGTPPAIVHLVTDLYKGAIESVVSCSAIEFRYMLPRRSRGYYPELYSGLVPLHVLYHSCEGPIFGFEMIQELQRHGYNLSAGTMYPLLHGMERKGLLRSHSKSDGRRTRRFYRATPAGRQALAEAKLRVRELFAELFRR